MRSTFCLGSVLLVTCLCLTLSGCYTTKAYSRGASSPGSQAYESRQWFTLGGLVGLSGPAADECSAIESSESGLAGMDIVINIVLTLGGMVLPALTCDTGDTSCISSRGMVGSLMPFLLQSRTVRYRCATKASAAALRKMPSLSRSEGGATPRQPVSSVAP